MTNSERYRAAFRHLHAPADAARRAQEMLEHPAGSTAHAKRRRIKPLIAAAAVLLVLGGAVGAEAASGEISNLLAPLYGGSQTALVDSIGVPLNASVTDNGYTLTAEAVLGDRFHFMVVYTLTRDDGEPIPEGTTVDTWEPTHFGSGGGDLQIIREGLPDHQMRLVESYGGRAPVLGRYYTVTMQNLIRFDEGDYENKEMIAEGAWTLGFALRFRDSTVKVNLHDTPVTGMRGGLHTLHTLEISPLGLYVTLTVPTAEYDLLNDMETGNMRPVLRLADGTLLDQMPRGGSGSSWTKGDEFCKAHIECNFPYPVSLEDMEAIIFNDVEIPLNLS